MPGRDRRVSREFLFRQGPACPRESGSIGLRIASEGDAADQWVAS